MMIGDINDYNNEMVSKLSNKVLYICALGTKIESAFQSVLFLQRHISHQWYSIGNTATMITEQLTHQQQDMHPQDIFDSTVTKNVEDFMNTRDLELNDDW
mmetsp:Transcript_13675/g.17189  ORF Transcript_13675/g.17189 Transcript_13675/m.17189 type:complete len:100 (+) Transcript_13675:160-459(+)